MFRRDKPGFPTRAALARDGVADSHGGDKGTGRA